MKVAYYEGLIVAQGSKNVTVESAKEAANSKDVRGTRSRLDDPLEHVSVVASVSQAHLPSGYRHRSDCARRWDFQG